MEECICLKCWAPYRPRKFGSANRSCAACGSRIVKDLKQVAAMIQTIQPILQTTAFEQTPVDDDILNVPFRHAVKIIHNLRVLASLWDPAKLSTEDFLVLQIRKGVPPEHGKNHLVDQQELPAEEEPETDLESAGKLPPPGKAEITSTPGKSLAQDMKEFDKKETELARRKDEAWAQREKVRQTDAPDHAWECPKCKHPNAGKQATCKKCGASWKDKAKAKKAGGKKK